MPYKIECPFCAARIEVPDELDETTTACPSCNQEIYLTREEAMEDLDPAVESIRRQTAAANKARMDNLRDVMRIQEQQRQTHNFVKWIVYIFIVFPLVFWVLWYLIAFVIGCFTGKL